MTDFPRYTADGDPIGPPPRCVHKHRLGECPSCDRLAPAPADFRALVESVRLTKGQDVRDTGGHDE